MGFGTYARKVPVGQMVAKTVFVVQTIMDEHIPHGFKAHLVVAGGLTGGLKPKKWVYDGLRR